MKPLALELSAFGPYPDAQQLDFEQLPQGTLFLVHGPTGSGKTTILDAMCFALHGDASGPERQSADMRSQLAEPDSLTRVRFDFALGSERFRVERIPEQQRPRKRGSGFTTQKKDATFWPLDETGLPGEPIATGWSKVNEAVSARLGLDSQQFRQVVLLPQGRFRELLLADSKQREAILEQLFDTERFRRLEEALRERALQMRRESAELDVEELQVARSALKLLGGVQVGDEPVSRETLGAAEQARVIELEAAAKAEEQARLAHESARRQLQEGREAAKRLAELERARSRIAELTAKAPLVDGQREELKRARQAERLRPALERRDRAERERDKAAKEHAAAREAEAGATARAREAAAVLERESAAAREDERETARRELTRQLDLRDEVERLGEARRAETKAAEARETKAVELEHARDALAALDAELLAAREAVQAQDALAAQRDKREAEHDRAKRREAEARELARRRSELAAVEKTLTKARHRLDQASARLETAIEERDAIERAHEAGEAERLAQGLADGQPCPVCGSTEHPAPARGDSELPSAEARKEAAAALESATQLRDDRAREVAQLDERRQARLAELEAQVARLGRDGDEDLESLVEATQAAERSLEEARAATERALETREALGVLETSRERALEKKDALREELDRLQTAAAVATQQRCDREDGVPEALRDAGALDESLRGLEARVRELEASLDRAREEAAKATTELARATTLVESTRTRLRTSEEECESAASALDEALEGSGFEDEAALQDAARSPDELQALEDAIASHDETRAAAVAELARCTREAEGLEPPELEALEASQRQAEALQSERADERTRLDQDLKNGRAALEQLGALDRRRAELDERFGPLGRVAELASGTNERKLSLHRFVLGALLDEVLDVASVRLSRMSRSRYRLRRADSLRDGRRAAGLDLLVHDAYSGEERPVSTLSGGESFLAALALALALAQVVQEHAGGVQLDALFVDEGFGSLDADALDLALSTLVELGREGGRMVGVISHVGELAERIDTRLQVDADARGSRARFVLP